MTPIQEILNRICWDKEYRRGCFEVGYYDRNERTVHRLPFTKVVFPAGAGRVLQVVDDTGQNRRIPLHRIREVLKDGQIIWQRSA